MNTAVLHISDLHITNHKNDEGKIISESWLTTSFDDYLEELSKFINGKKEKFNISRLLLIVSGDLSNASAEGEYPQTTTFLNNLAKNLSIELDDILIVPGNHDVNWAKSSFAFSKDRENNIKNEIKPYTFHKEKYVEFKKFYDSFFNDSKNKEGKIFNHEKAIVDIVKIDDYEIAFLGINSTYKCSHTDQYNPDANGFINSNNLEKEIKAFKKEHQNWIIVAVFHHNAESNISGNKVGIENWISIRNIFAKYDINTFIFGHEHTPGGFSLTHNLQFNYIATGSTGKKNISNYLNILTFENTSSKLQLNVKFCGLQKDGNKQHFEFGYWTELPDIDQQTEFVLREIVDSPISSKDIFPKQKTNPIKKNKRKKQKPATQSEIIKDYSSELLRIIKQNKLFKSGHFHWSDNAKAHNWLDTSKLLSKKEHLHLTKNSIINLIKDNKLDCDLIIGLGLEGNVIASKAAVYFNKPYTYLPYSYRYSDHDSYEKEITVKSTYKSVLIITDVLHNGSTLTSLILKNEKKFFDNVSKICVVSLFYTGKGDYSVDMLNKNGENRFEYYYVCDEIKVEGCPYGDDFRTKCKIYSQKLDFVYEFYNVNEK